MNIRITCLALALLAGCTATPPVASNASSPTPQGPGHPSGSGKSVSMPPGATPVPGAAAQWWPGAPPIGIPPLPTPRVAGVPRPLQGLSSPCLNMTEGPYLSPHMPLNVTAQTAPATPSTPAETAVQKQDATATARSEVLSTAPRNVAIQPHVLQVHPRPASRERYQPIGENPIQQVAADPVSTFSVDVDTGSYANVRRMLSAGCLPIPDAVRVEELVNYFGYDYATPRDAHPFAVHTEVAAAPWNPDHALLRIAVKGKDLAKDTLPPANLVFLVDVSGSMATPERLPLIKSSLRLLVESLRPQDRISLVTYAGRTAIVLMAVPGDQKSTILNAIDGLQPGGGTAGGSGIELAYRVAGEGFIKGGINRILLATDGDFNVGVTDFRQLKAMVEERRKSGVSLSTLGVGSGNYNEHLMEQLADAGNGAYSYLDSLMEGHKVLVNEMTSTLATIAQDVKVQVEFNPAAVQEYRLIGYENRALKREDFKNDQVDAGDIGAGHTVTALYELTPVGAAASVDSLRYGQPPARTAVSPGGKELAFVKLRYKLPGEATSRPMEVAVSATPLQPIRNASTDFRFATAVASFGELLRGGKYLGRWRIQDARELASEARGTDRFGHRGEFLRLADLAASLATRKAEPPASSRAPNDAGFALRSPQTP